ncbi:MAG: TSCPD domain-containing protein [Planctomycetota bacterium]|nr:TSCPD domain-containing protein [Planctomycetota bacterium]
MSAPEKVPEKDGCMYGVTIKQKTACGNMYITFNMDSEKKKMKKIFITLGKAGTCAKTFTEMAGRLLGIGLKTNIDINRVVKNLTGMQCSRSTEILASCPTAIAQALLQFKDIVGDNESAASPEKK